MLYFNQITPDYCKKVVEHVKRIEEGKYKAEDIIDTLVDEIKLTIGEDSDSEEVCQRKYFYQMFS